MWVCVGVCACVGACMCVFTEWNDISINKDLPTSPHSTHFQLNLIFRKLFLLWATIQILVLALFSGPQKLEHGVLLTLKTAVMHLGNLFSSFIFPSPLHGLISKSFTTRSFIYPKVAFVGCPRSLCSVFMSVPGSLLVVHFLAWLLHHIRHVHMHTYAGFSWQIM